MWWGSSLALPALAQHPLLVKYTKLIGCTFVNVFHELFRRFILKENKSVVLLSLKVRMFSLSRG